MNSVKLEREGKTRGGEGDGEWWKDQTRGGTRRMKGKIKDGLKKTTWCGGGPQQGPNCCCREELI
eukprot:1964781-Ditylum_brightwellii.AAC.1